MSDPKDPYRFTDIGGGINPFGEKIWEIIPESKEIADSFKNITNEGKKFKKTFDELEKVFHGIAPITQSVSKELNKSQFFKSVKGLGGMFKSIMGASPKASAISSFVSKISGLASPLGKLFDPLNTGLDIAKGAVEIFVSSALKPMYDAMQPLYTSLLDTLGPASELGTAFGEALAPALEDIAEPLGDLIAQIGTSFANILVEVAPLIGEFLVKLVEFIGTLADMFLPILEEIVPFMADQLIQQFISLFEIFESLMPVIGPILEILMKLMALGMVPLTVILEVISDILEPLMPLFEDLGEMLNQLSPALAVLTPIITQLIKWSLLPLVGAIYAIGVVVAAFIQLFTGKQAVSKWNEMMLPVLKSLAIPGYGEEKEGMGPQGGSHFAGSTHGPSHEQVLAGMQHGGITMSEGLYHLHAPEAVIPLDRFTQQQNDQKNLLVMINDQLMQLSEAQRKLNRMKESKYVFTRMK